MTGSGVSVLVIVRLVVLTDSMPPENSDVSLVAAFVAVAVMILLR
jgi:hypothetical protein